MREVQAHDLAVDLERAEREQGGLYAIVRDFAVQGVERGVEGVGAGLLFEEEPDVLGRGAGPALQDLGEEVRVVAAARAQRLQQQALARQIGQGIMGGAIRKFLLEFDTFRQVVE